ncbi:xanthine dehydrogenase accessory protein XdhC [Thalassococcus sp. CAU 1522]|uniref:Xanthine dehydrogenase accessory protein XdhC n=1 Tax=Thalassococcus arenae TaxID=2851652 RepID=A0ABS6N540_9RHOB|nr:xanthine dehydrogenase accessory protein XdhC [Thalassococcus arenae]MBV2358802.1 xanthine dehydrogenase accessory protein XdhC [Thalassococcus arenae]
MALDLDALRDAVAAHGRVARVVVAEVRGSAPREVGAAMLVWSECDGFGQSGTIGGGALEYEAVARAFARQGLSRHPLGPSLGQCCGGAVALWTEHFDAAALDALQGETVFARGPGAMPLGVARILDRARARGEAPVAQLVQGWMVEAIAAQRMPLWIWGAGHVGRAIVDVVAPLHRHDITWVDTGPGRFPQDIPAGVTALPATDPVLLMPRAPDDAAHLVLTYSHELDLRLCDALLRHRFGWAGLIGSDTKKARFASRLRALGHADATIARIACPIGDKSLGKQPQAIAIGVAAQLLKMGTGKNTAWTTSSSASTA